MPVIEVENSTMFQTMQLAHLLGKCRGDDLVWLENRPYAITKRGRKVRIQSLDAWNIGLYRKDPYVEIWDEQEE